MFTDGLIECQRDIIPLNGVTAKGMKNLIDFAYSSKLLLDFGKYKISHQYESIVFLEISMACVCIHIPAQCMKYFKLI